MTRLWGSMFAPLTSPPPTAPAMLLPHESTVSHEKQADIEAFSARPQNSQGAAATNGSNKVGSCRVDKGRNPSCVISLIMTNSLLTTSSTLHSFYMAD